MIANHVYSLALALWWKCLTAFKWSFFTYLPQTAPSSIFDSTLQPFFLCYSLSRAFFPFFIDFNANSTLFFSFRFTSYLIIVVIKFIFSLNLKYYSETYAFSLPTTLVISIWATIMSLIQLCCSIYPRIYSRLNQSTFLNISMCVSTMIF